MLFSILLLMPVVSIRIVVIIIIPFNFSGHVGVLRVDVEDLQFLQLTMPMDRNATGRRKYSFSEPPTRESRESAF